MNRIDINCINFELLEKLPNQGSFSITYKDSNDICYKIFKGLYYYEKVQIQKNFKN